MKNPKDSKAKSYIYVILDLGGGLDLGLQREVMQFTRR